MGFRVEQAQGTSVGITHRPPRQKITISVVVNAEELLEQPASKREKWLDDQAGVKLKLPAAVKKELKSAFNVEEVLEALGKRLSPHTPRGLNPGSLVLQPTAERRRSRRRQTGGAAHQSGQSGRATQRGARDGRSAARAGPRAAVWLWTPKPSTAVPHRALPASSPSARAAGTTPCQGRRRAYSRMPF